MDTAQRQLEEKALEWLLKLESDDSPECRKGFLEWCEQSRDHVHAFLEVTALDRQLNRIDAAGSVDLEALIRECRGSAEDNVVALSGTPSQDSPQRLARPWRRIGRWAAAALISGLLLVAAVRLGNGFDPTYATQLGEQRSIKLEDGSMIYLNTHSRVRPRYSAHAREIELLEGEAYFVAAEDSARPFRVVAGDATVQALGTQFNVYREARQTKVSVVEGHVQLIADAVPVTLAAGEAANVADGRIAKDENPEVLRATAWRQRQLDFRRSSLFDVAREFNRYNTTQIEIADRDLGERLLNGVFDADAPEQLIGFLQQGNDVWFERRAKTIVIHSGAKP